MDKVNLTLQETAFDMDSLNNSLGKISSSKGGNTGNQEHLLDTGLVPQKYTFYASLLISH